MEFETRMFTNTRGFLNIVASGCSHQYCHEYRKIVKLPSSMTHHCLDIGSKRLKDQKEGKTMLNNNIKKTSISVFNF